MEMEMDRRRPNFPMAFETVANITGSTRNLKSSDSESGYGSRESQRGIVGNFTYLS
jgi:hypothetical protein